MAFDLFDAEGRISLNDRDLETGLRGAKRKVAATMEEIRQMRAEAEIKADIRDVKAKQKEVAAAVREMDSMEAELKAKLGTKEFDAQYADLERKVHHLDGQEIKLRVELDQRKLAVQQVVRGFRTMAQEARKGETALERVRSAWGRFNREQVNVGPFNLAMKTMLVGLSLLGPQIVAVVGALGALTAAVGAAAGGAFAVGGAAMAALGIAAVGLVGAIKPAITELGIAKKATDAYNQAVLKYGKDSKQAKTAQQQMNNVLKGISPGAREAAKEISGLQTAWTKATGPARKLFFDTVGEGAKTLKALMPTLSKSTNEFAKTLHDGFSDWMKGLRSGEGKGIIDTLLGNFNKALPDAMHALGQFGAGLGRVFANASRYFAPFTQWLDKLGTSFSDATKNGPALTHTIDTMADSAKRVGAFLGAAAKAVVALFKPGVEPGNDLFDHMTRSLNNFTQWANSPTGTKKLQDFFQQSADDARALFNALKPIVSMLAAWQHAMAPISAAFIKVAGAVGKVVSALAKIPGFQQAIEALFAVFVAGKILSAARAIGQITKELIALTKVRSAGALADVLGLGGGAAGGAAKKAEGQVARDAESAGSGAGAAAAGGFASRFRGLLPGLLKGAGIAAGAYFAQDFIASILRQIGGKLPDAIANTLQGKNLASQINPRPDIRHPLDNPLIKDGPPSSATQTEQFKLMSAAITDGRKNLAELKKELDTPGGSGFTKSQEKALLDLAKSPLTKVHVDVMFLTKGDKVAQAVIARLQATKIGQKLMNIVAKGGPQAELWLARLSETKLGQKLLDIISRGGPQASKIVEELQNKKLRQKVLEIAQKGGPDVVKELQKILGVRFPAKTQRILQSGAQGVQHVIAAINAMKLVNKLTHLMAKDEATGVINSVWSALNKIPAVKTVSIIAGGLGHAIFGKRASGGPLKRDPIEKALAEAATPTKTTGGLYSKPKFLVGDHEGRGGPAEVVISPDPAFRKQNVAYWQRAAKMLGIPGFAGGHGGTPRATGGHVQSRGPEANYSSRALDTLTGDRSTIAKQERKIDELGKAYDRKERSFTISFGDTDFLNPDGTRNESAIATKVGQIKELIAMKQRIQDAVQALQTYIQSALSTVREAIKQMQHAYHRMHDTIHYWDYEGTGKKRHKVRKAKPNQRKKDLLGVIQDYQDAVPGLQQRQQDAHDQFLDLDLDKQDLSAQMASISATPESTTPQERQENALNANLALAQIGQGPGGESVADALNALVNFNQGEISRAQGMLADSDPTNDQAAYALIQQAAGNIQNYQGQASGGAGGGTGTGGVTGAGIVSEMSGFYSARDELYSQFGGNMVGYGPGGAPGGGTMPQRVTNVTNNYQQQPEDPHTWSQQLTWELEAVL